MSKHTEELQRLGELTINEWLAVGIKLGGRDKVRQLLSCEKVTVAFDSPNKEAVIKAAIPTAEPTRSWREEDGVIYFSVTSDGRTGPQWVERFEGRGFPLNRYDRSVLLSDYFKPTDGITTEIAILKGMLFEDSDRFTTRILAEAERRGLAEPNAEVACLIGENFSDMEIRAMGLQWILVMYMPIVSGLCLFGAYQDCYGRWLPAYYVAGPDSRWDREYGFAFVVPQVEFTALNCI